METPSAKKKLTAENIKKYSPFILLLVLTVVLMLFFRSNRKGISSMIEEGKKSLLSLYTGGLKPLISETEISQEDLFNFALYQSLPLDQSKKKALVLSNNDGQQIYDIKPANFNPNTKNFETFKNFLNLNSKQRQIVDSVLSSYRKEIYACVLVNEKNAYAVNPKITEVQRAMLADLVYFAQKVDYEKAQNIFPGMEDMNRTELASLVKSGREIPSTKYLLMTPDTVAETDFTWNEEQFENQVRAFEEGKMAATEFASNQAFKWDGPDAPPEPPSVREVPEKMKFKIDSNKYRISVNVSDLSKMINDSVRINLEKVAKQLQNITVQHSGKRSSRSSSSGIRIVPPIPEISITTVDPIKITSEALKMVGSMNISQLVEDAMKNDSSFQAAMKDSANSKKFQQKMKEVNRKLKRLNLDTLRHKVNRD
ncbi:MAG: hypothetical protein WCZ90_07540 [Melioribacteraceae bacterium]